MIVKPSVLRRLGIVGMNRRNLRYIHAYNNRALYPAVDDKLKTRLLAQQADIPSARVIGVVRRPYEVRDLGKWLPANGFVLKPAKGSGGKGILVISESSDRGHRKSNGRWISDEDLQRHAHNTLAGLFSLGGTPDVVLVEELIRSDDTFADYSVDGVPDIRIIVFRGYPVMAMLRLATHASDGKANLHQGAVGVGIDIANGRAVGGVQFDRPVSHHPDSGQPLQQLAVPHWPTLLDLAARCHEMSGLGYLGADLVLDKHRGPLLLELNARPGLSIQVANRQGLEPRLRHIEQDAPTGVTPAQRIAYVRRVFGKPVSADTAPDHDPVPNIATAG
jgi:alpha-L-glutamate ligase-like protein